MTVRWLVILFVLLGCSARPAIASETVLTGSNEATASKTCPDGLRHTVFYALERWTNEGVYIRSAINNPIKDGGPLIINLCGKNLQTGEVRYNLDRTVTLRIYQQEIER